MLKSLFAKKKKDSFKAKCDLTNVPLEKEFTYLVSTAQILTSKKFWDNKMTEPDTLSYTVNHFKNGDQTATHIRKMIYDKYASEDKLWVISDSQINLFDVDQDEAKSLADMWWESKGTYIPETLDSSLSKLDEDKIEEYKAYAIMYAGKQQVAAQL